MFRGLHRAHFHLIAVPRLHVHRAIYVLQLESPARRQRICLVEFFAGRKARHSRSRRQSQRQNRSEIECTASHNRSSPRSLSISPNRTDPKPNIWTKDRAETHAQEALKLAVTSYAVLAIAAYTCRIARPLSPRPHRN